MIEDDIYEVLSEELQKAIDKEILAIITDTPKLKFRKSQYDPCILEYGMEYSRGTFTPTGLRDEHVEPVAKWCFDNSCGVVHKIPYQIVFKNEAEVAWFLLAWA